MCDPETGRTIKTDINLDLEREIATHRRDATTIRGRDIDRTQKSIRDATVALSPLTYKTKTSLRSFP